MGGLFTILIPTKVSEAVQNHRIKNKMNGKLRHCNEGVNFQERNVAGQQVYDVQVRSKKAMNNVVTDMK